MRLKPEINNQYLSDLGKQIQTLPPDEASVLLLEGSIILLFAGFPQNAYEGFVQLTHGELQVSKSSCLALQIWRLFVSLCYFLQKPLPSIFGEPERALDELAEYIDVALWNRFGNMGFDLSAANRCLRRCENFAERRSLQQLEPLDYREEESLMYAIRTYLEMDKHDEADKLIHHWWHSMANPRMESHCLYSMPRLVTYLSNGRLRDAIPISQGDATRFLKAVERRTFDAEAPGFIPTPDDWRAFLKQWSTAIFDNLDPECMEVYEDEYPDVLEDGVCFYDGATEKDLDKLEERLGKKLPPSYRSFLLASNGFIALNRLGSDFYCTDDILWFVEEHLDWAAIWGDADTDDIDDERYFQYGEHQDCCWIRGRYLQSALQISSTEEGEVFLLNPEIVDSRGEWEAWDFGNDHPGAIRYRSFWDMAQALYRQTFDRQ